MDNTKITISIDGVLLGQIDSLVRKRVFSNRGHAIRTAVREGIVNIGPDLGTKKRSKPSAAVANMFPGAVEPRKWPEF